MLIWIPAPIDEVRPELHKSGTGSGVIVPVHSGTVVVPRDRMGPSYAVQWVYGVVRQAKKTAVVVTWDDAATVVLPVSGAVALGWEWGGDEAVRGLISDLGALGPVRQFGLKVVGALATPKHGPDKQSRAANRIAQAFGADKATVLRYIQQFEQRLPPDVLLDAIGKPDVAAVARQIDAGRFDVWRTGRSLKAEWYRFVGAALLAAVVVGTIMATVFALVAPPLVPLATTVLPALLIIVLLVYWRRIRYRTTRMPIDEVMPVVQGPEASDNQSAK